MSKCDGLNASLHIDYGRWTGIIELIIKASPIYIFATVSVVDDSTRIALIVQLCVCCVNLGPPPIYITASQIIAVGAGLRC